MDEIAGVGISAKAPLIDMKMLPTCLVPTVRFICCGGMMGASMVRASPKHIDDL